MIYSFDIGRLPKIENIYTVVRKTVWQIADPHHILLIILDGACNVELEEKSYRLQRGDILFIPENQIYKRTPENGSMCKMLYIHFTTAAPIKELAAAEAIEEVRALQARTENALLNNVKSLLPQNNSIYLRTLCHAGGQDVLEICGRMERLLYKFSLDSTLSLVLYLCQILSVASRENLLYLKARDTNADLIHIPPGLKKAVLFIKQNCSAKVTLDDLCLHCNRSKSQLIRDFKAVFNKTPAQYIISFKLNRAKELFLNAPQLPIKTVCSELGFDDQHYFSRLFTRVNGETPSHYKYRITHFKND